MADVQLIWRNKHLTLRARGDDEYEWLEPSDERLRRSLRIEALTGAGPDPQSNVLAIGDGMDVLEALASNAGFFGDGIRLAYIDPPFNTQGRFRHYRDDLDRATWLSMLRDRLQALRPHLASDASVWVHLDDSELHRARAVMDEVFGEQAFVASVVWQTRTTRDSRAAFSSNHDTILVYAPSGPKKWKLSRNLLVKDNARLRNRDNDPRGPWADAPFTAPGYRRAQQYVIETPTGQKLRPPRGRSWYATESTFVELVKDGRIWFPKGGDGSPRLKLFAHQLRGLVPFTVWGPADTGTNDDAKRHLLTMFPDRDVFDTPKPESLMERIIHIATNPGELVVDIFGGSGSTAAVAHKMRRRWLIAERNAQTVQDFLLPRLERVLDGTDQGGISDAVDWRGGGSYCAVYVPPRFGNALSPSTVTLMRRTLSAMSTRRARVAVSA